MEDRRCQFRRVVAPIDGVGPGVRESRRGTPRSIRLVEDLPLGRLRGHARGDRPHRAGAGARDPATGCGLGDACRRDRERCWLHRGRRDRWSCPVPPRDAAAGNRHEPGRLPHHLGGDRRVVRETASPSAVDTDDGVRARRVRGTDHGVGIPDDRLASHGPGRRRRALERRMVGGRDHRSPPGGHG